MLLIPLKLNQATSDLLNRAASYYPAHAPAVSAALWAAVVVPRPAELHSSDARIDADDRCPHLFWPEGQISPAAVGLPEDCCCDWFAAVAAVVVAVVLAASFVVAVAA